MAAKAKVQVPTTTQLIKGIKTPEGFERSVTTTPKDHRGYGGFKVLTLESPDTKIELHFEDDPNAYFLASGHVDFETALGTRTFDRRGVEDSFYVDNPTKWTDRRIWTGDRVVHGKKVGTVISGAGYVGWGDDRKYVDECQILWDDADPQVPTCYTERQLKTARVRHAGPIEQANEAIRKVIEERIPKVRAQLDESERVPSIPFTVTADQKRSIGETLRAGGYHRFMPSGFGTGYTLTKNRTRFGERGSSELAKFFGVGSIYLERIDAD